MFYVLYFVWLFMYSTLFQLFLKGFINKAELRKKNPSNKRLILCNLAKSTQSPTEQNCFCLFTLDKFFGKKKQVFFTKREKWSRPVSTTSRQMTEANDANTFIHYRELLSVFTSV